MRNNFKFDKVTPSERESLDNLVKAVRDSVIYKKYFDTELKTAEAEQIDYRMGKFGIELKCSAFKADGDIKVVVRKACNDFCNTYALGKVKFSRTDYVVWFHVDGYHKAQTVDVPWAVFGNRFAELVKCATKVAEVIDALNHITKRCTCYSVTYFRQTESRELKSAEHGLDWTDTTYSDYAPRLLTRVFATLMNCTDVVDYNDFVPYRAEIKVSDTGDTYKVSF